MRKSSSLKPLSCHRAGHRPGHDCSAEQDNPTLPRDWDASAAVTVVADRVVGATEKRVSAEPWLEWAQALKC